MPHPLSRFTRRGTSFVVLLLMLGGTAGCVSETTARPQQTRQSIAAPAPAPSEAGQSNVTPEPPDARKDQVWLENAAVRLAVSPGTGRITWFGPVGGDNLLWLADHDTMEPIEGRDGKPYFNLGGDKVWPLLQSLWARAYGGRGEWPPDGTIDGQPWTLLEHTDRQVVMESQVQPDLGVKVRRKIVLRGDEPTVGISNVVVQVNATVFPVQVWTVTQVRRPQSVTLDASLAKPPAQPFVWMGGKPMDITLKADADNSAVAWDLRNQEVGKIGTFGQTISALYEKMWFHQATVSGEDGMYPDGSNLQLYVGDDYIELETLSPARHLQPGEEIDHLVVWSLKRHDR